MYGMYMYLYMIAVSMHESERETQMKYVQMPLIYSKTFLVENLKLRFSIFWVQSWKTIAEAFSLALIFPMPKEKEKEFLSY